MHTDNFRRVYSDPEPDVSSPAAENASSKHRRKRTTFTQHQATVLEKVGAFLAFSFACVASYNFRSEQMQWIAATLQMSP